MLWAFSDNEESYHYGDQPSREAAIEEGIQCYGLEPGDTLWVGRCVTPRPEDHAPDGEDLIEWISERDEFSGEWAEGWCKSTKEQDAELTAAIRKAVADWLDKHGLRPRFFNVVDSERIVVGDGK